MTFCPNLFRSYGEEYLFYGDGDIMAGKFAFQGGLELNFFAQREIESTKGIESEKQAPIIARNVLRFLIMGWSDSWTQFLTTPIAHAVFIKRNHELLRELRLAFQQGFFELFNQLKDKKLTLEQKEQAHLYLSNCIALLPYADLTPYESIKIPQYLSEKWEMVEYQVTPIELTAVTGWRRFFIRDSDRVFAYGLEPLFQKKAESHLIFMGTTYPAGQGFLSQVNTDLKGFETVGKSLYRSGRKRIQHWLSQQDNTIHVCGISLGGSLSLLLAIDAGNYVLSRVDALNPAGLHNAWRKSQYDRWDELCNKPKVVVQKQCNDPISAFGIWKRDWDIIHVVAREDKKGPNSFCDHVLNYACFSDTKFTYIEAEQDNAKRRALNFLLYSLGRGLIYYTVLAPYTYIVRPLKYFIMQQLFLSASIIGCVLAVGFLFGSTLAGIAFLAGSGMLLSSWVVSTSWTNKKNLNNTSSRADEVNFAKMHHPSLPRNAIMDIYNMDNAVELNLTRKQIQTYYQIMRCLVKEKNFLPSSHKESKHVKGVTKKELLEESLDSKKADDLIPFKVTKGKAAHIKHTLSTVSKLGVDNIDIKPVLIKKYKEYRMGKH